MQISNLYAELSFHKNGNLSKEVQDIFLLLGVSFETLEEANTFAQKYLLKTEEVLNNKIQNDFDKKIILNKDSLLVKLSALGMVDEITPSRKDWNYALLMGSFKEDVIVRLEYLIGLIKKSYNFKEIILLSGDRPLLDHEKKGLPSEIKTEGQMIQYLAANNKMLEGHKVRLINAPMIKKPDGTWSRPTTDTTLICFAQLVSLSGSCLVISENPFIIRQTKVAQRILDQSKFPTEGSGAAIASNAIDIVMIMDEFSRRLYEEFRQYKLQKERSF